MNLHIYAEPSIPPSFDRRILSARGAKLHPPVKRFDVENLVARSENPGILIIIDGFFHMSCSVALSEIRSAIQQGWQVWGGGSMGALRAVECEAIGMIGIGRVFRWFRFFRVEDDDEVAQTLHPETGAPLSEAMVDLRYIVQRLHRENIVDVKVAKAILFALKEEYYPYRSFSLLFSLLQTHLQSSQLDVARVLALAARKPKQQDFEYIIRKALA